MATQDTSPSLIIGQQWSALTELMASCSTNHEEEPEKDENRNASDSMKLGRHDMGLFGFCPSREEFNLVVCEKCKLLVKPQALKQHIETRHGSTNLGSLGTIPASALNSELGKKLLMPLPSKSSTPPPPSSKSSSAPSVERQASGTFKPVSSGRPPTKASLKQVPATLKNSPAPILGVSMKISPIKSVKAGNRISSSSSTGSGQSSSVSNPVVKVEKLSKLPAPTAAPKTERKPIKPEPSSEKSGSIMSMDSSKISTLMNGSLKTAVSLTSPVSITSSLLSTSVHVTVTKTSTDTPVSTRSVTTLVTTTTLTKPVMIAPVMAISSAVSMTPKSAPVAKSGKGSKDHKEKKNLPCKDREYDANKHCGVTIVETGKQCTRSLTCKTHALSLRRAVTGRSKSFDDLLKEHKAANDAFKAKASNQSTGAAISAAGLPGSSPKRVLISPGIMNSSLGTLKQFPIAPAQKEGKLVPSGSTVSTLQAKLPLSAVPTTTTKPRNMFQRFSSSAILPPVITVKEDVSVKQEPTRRPSQTPASTAPSVLDSQEAKPDPSYLPHHPKPMATCQFGGRLNDRGSLLFSRKMDYVRAAFLSALERQLNPPPHKKLCVESNLPKESQMQGNSQDPYEFNMMDTSGSGAVAGGAAQASSVNMSASLVNIAKPTAKPKSKTPSSPAGVACTNPLALPTINLSPASVAGSLSLSSTPVVGCPSASPSGLALNWSVKPRDNSLSRSPTSSPSPHASNMPNPGKRKRSGSSGASGSGGGQQLIAVAAGGNTSLPLTPGVSIASVSIAGATAATQQAGLTGVVTSSSLNSQHNQTGNFITIPGVNLTSANLSQLNTGSLGVAAKISAGSTPSTSSASATAASTAHGKNNLFKDFNLVLTGIDSLANGQYMNLTGAHLAELAASQGQTLVLNNFNPAAITAAGSLAGATINLAGAGGVTTTSSSNTSRPAKRIRSSSSKSGSSSSSSSASSHHLTLAANSSKLQAGALEGIKLIPSGSLNLPSGLPPNTVLMDSSSLQGAVLTSVALGTGGTTPTLMAISSSMANNSQVLCADSASSQLINSSTIVNGLCSSSSDKSSSNSQRHHISKSHHHHHHPHHQHHQPNSGKSQQQQQQQQSITLGSMLQSAGGSSIAMPLAQGTTGTALFKQGGTTFNLTKTVGGKVTMQPVSLTFPIVSQAGLVALTSSKQQQQQNLQQQLQQQQQQQQQHTLLVSSSSGSGGELVDASAVRVAGKSDMHLQAQLSSSSPGNLIS